MKQTELELLYSYYFNKQSRLQCDVDTFKNKFRLREADQVDCLEEIIALTRLQAFNEYSIEVAKLLKIPPFQIGISSFDMDIDNQFHF